MDQLIKNGAPDLWIGNDLYEVKRGNDRLSPAQREWARRYNTRTEQKVGVVHFEREFFGGWIGRVFACFDDFDAFIRGYVAESDLEFDDEIFQKILDVEYNRIKS